MNSPTQNNKPRRGRQRARPPDAPVGYYVCARNANGGLIPVQGFTLCEAARDSLPEMQPKWAYPLEVCTKTEGVWKPVPLIGLHSERLDAADIAAIAEEEQRHWQTKAHAWIISLPDAEDAALARALHSYVGSADRWRKRRVTGLSDAALKEAIGQEFGTTGGFGGPGCLSSWHHGGKDPRIRFGDDSHASGSWLKGPPLLDRVRALLDVPLPDDLTKGKAA